jgi:hypothetical protein
LPVKREKIHFKSSSQMTHSMLLLSALLLSLPLASLAADPSEQCSQLHIPRANVEFALLHINAFSAVEDMAKTACKSFNVPQYKCGGVRKDVLETMQEMGRLAIREAVVNVSLDRSLAYEIWLRDDNTYERVKASEPLTVYPEQPLADTVSEYCARFKIDSQDCANMAVGVGDLLARDWGCDDPVADKAKDIVEIPIVLDQYEHQLRLDLSTDGTADAARFCLEKKIHIAECAALFRIVHEQIEILQAKRAAGSGEKKEEELGQRTGGRRRLRFDSPIDTRLYPRAERVIIKMDWERRPDEEVTPEEICVYSEGSSSPKTCFPVPQTEPLSLTANSAEGYHMLYFTDKSGKEILAAKMIQLVVPNVELVELFSSKAKPDSSDSESLGATIRTTLFDPFDPAFRVCVLLDELFDCLDPEWMTLEAQELRHGTQTEPLHQSVTFRAPLDHVLFTRANDHEVSILLLTENNKAVQVSSTVAFDAALNVNPPGITSRRHMLDPRLHTPQRPRSCPGALRSSPTLRWICDLWRHEWGLYSQNGEDGILRNIFHHIGTTHKAYVEFGTESGHECNTRLLREMHGWTGLLMDSRHEDAGINLFREFITRDNFMTLLTDKYRTLVPRDLDLLSIDVDFNDFWLLSALDLTRVAPRVVLVEVNSHIPSSEARTVAYDDRTDGSGGWDGFSAYFGASVAAFHRWGARNGYSLLYCESHGVNCFLVRNDALGEVNVSAVLGPDQLQAPPNFFGQGWDYPDVWQPHHQWEWL